MTISEREFANLREQAERARAAKHRAKGKLEAAMARLKEDYDCDTLEQAEALLATLEAEADAAETAYDLAVAKFKEDWADAMLAD